MSSTGPSDTEAPLPTKILRLGHHGVTVRNVQKRLTQLGFDLVVDSQFGPRTQEAVATFQASQGLTVDGIVGPATHAALRDAVPTIAAADPRSGQEVLATVLTKDPDLGEPQRRVLERALAFLGAKELYGSNRGPEIDPMVGGYAEHVSLASANQGPPWCAIFLSSAIKQGLGFGTWEATPMGDWLASAHSYEVWAKAAGLWSDEPAPGAVLVMKYVDRPGAGYSGHVGMVLWVGDDGAVVSVDGNVTDKVAVRHRRPDQIRGYVYWWKHPVVTARFPLPLEPAEWVTLETTPMDEVDMPLIDNGTKARLAAIKARLGGELVEAREEIKAARQDKRDTESGSPERVAARAALAALRADRKETKADLRDVAQAIREFEREHGLRPAAVDDWIAEKIGLVIHRILNAVGQQLEGLEGRVMEALPGLVAKAAASVVTQVDFSQIVPGAAGRALESVDEQVVATLLDVFEAWNDDDGLTMDDVETIARKRLAEAGIELTVAALHKRAMALLGS